MAFKTLLSRNGSLALVLIMAIFLLFLGFVVLKNTVFSGAGWLTPITGFNAGLIETALFAISIVVFLLAYKYSPRLETKELVLVVFLVFILLQSSVFLLNPSNFDINSDGWDDARGNYNLAGLVWDSGPLYYLGNYHGLSGDSLYYRADLHPPILPMVYSMFLVFGMSQLSLVFGQWVLSGISIILVFLFLKRFLSRERARKLAFLFMLTPIILLSGVPVPDPVMIIFFVATAWVFLVGVEKDSNPILFLSGILLSITFLAKFTGVFLFIPFLLILLYQHRLLGTAKFLLVLMGSLILPLLLYMIFNYNIIQNFLTGFEITSSYSSGVSQGTSGLIGILQPFYYLLYLGIPLLVISFLGYLSMVRSRRDFIGVVSISFLAGSLALVLLLPGHFIGKQLLPFMPFIILSGGKIGEKNNNIMALSFLVLIVQIVSFLWFI